MKKVDSLQKQVIIFLVLTMTAVIGLLCFAAYEIVGTSKDKDIAIAMNARTATEGERLNQEYIRFEDAITHMVGIANLYVTDIDDVKDPVKRAAITQNIQKVFSSVCKTTNMSLGYYFVYDPDLIGKQDGFFFTKSPSGKMESHELTVIKDYNPDDVEHVGWFTLPKKAQKPIWLEPYFNKNTGHFMITYVAPIYEDDQLLGIVGMDFDFEALLTLVDQIKFGKSGYAFLKSGNGDIHYHPNDYFANKVHGDSVIDITEATIEPNDTTSGNSLIRYQFNDEDYVQSFMTLRCGLKLVLCDNYTEMYKDREDLVALDIIVIVFCGILLLLLFSHYTRRMMQPIKQLTKAIGQLKDGEDDVDIPQNVSGEIGILAQGVAMAAAAIKEKRELSASALAEQNRKLEKAVEKARRANKAKSDFLSRMSHDIRTPMNAIVGLGLIAESNKDNPKKLSDCLRKISTSSKYLLSLINDVLDMSRIESGKLSITKEQVNIPEIIGSVVAMVGQQLEAHQHHMQASVSDIEHEVVISDALRLQQIFMNLLSNSIKYTPDGGKISIRVKETSVSTTRSIYSFIFKDNGIGMSMEFQERLFQPFTREQDDHQTEVKGTGLGMSITKAIVDLLEGQIQVSSAINEGTEITVSIDLEVVEQENRESVPAKPLEFSEIKLPGKRILLVDDISLNLEIAENILGMTGAEVDKTANGREALETVREMGEGYYDMIFMDARMPIMDGYTATRSIREIGTEYTVNLPIIAMSADVFAEDVEHFKQCGMNDFVAKPLDMHALAMVLQKYLL
ncbi:MAG: response regulator [Anaerovibrio sp.]|uniref:ATP-binding protein n=1 Tax=Anaerovibrio sp. TaxID=1872532 RepID=UPI0025CFA585|nr:hybrid sensor histidine kinase/response regulator [Anaerovibrio sp.]MCR5176025.1 response regulator [Anaerovibrio sp.]